MALGKEREIAIDPNLAVCLSRKDLVQILKKQFGGSIPKEHDLIEMEKSELLGLIENEMLIICYMTEKWWRDPIRTGTADIQQKPIGNIPTKKDAPKTDLKKKDDAKISK